MPLGRGRPISAISTGGIGEDGVCTTADLAPLGHAIQWNDRRGEVYAKALGQTAVWQSAIPPSCSTFSSSAGKWEWLHLNKPRELASAATWLTMTDYALAIWSGTPFMSATLAPRTGCYDVFTRQWIPQFLQAQPTPHPCPR